MPTAAQFRLIDAFAARPYSGNPAGVVIDADELDEFQMQAIAREINASETAFVSRTNDLHRPMHLRWFTPTSEVEFCGHATLAAIHALADAGCVDPSLAASDREVVFDTLAGQLKLYCEVLDRAKDATVWWLRMPDAGLKPDRGNLKRTCELLGLALDDIVPGIPITRTRDNDVILTISSRRRLFDMQPRFVELARWSAENQVRGYCVSTLDTVSRTTTVESRFFAPAVGINEDPVTGSVHGPLASLLVSQELVPFTRGRAVLNCLQGEPAGRCGLVRVLVERADPSYRVAISGQCFTTLTGELCVPPQRE